MTRKQREGFNPKVQKTTNHIKTKNPNNNLLTRTFCEIINCTNVNLCVSKGLATIPIMGDICTRGCSLRCRAKIGKPLPIDGDEPASVAQAVKQLKLKHVALTSVLRDDLPDGGASQFARTVNAIHDVNPGTSVEVIIHSSSYTTGTIKTIVESAPEVICYEITTVPRLYSYLYDNADYTHSIAFLETVKSLNPGIVTKSGLSLGLGENDYEVIKVMEDLHDSGCSCITLGQYIPDSTNNYQNNRHVSPQEFDEYQNLSMQMGYSSVRSGPFLCTSYDALEMYKEVAE